ncbi:MAG: TPM domain-containing protein [Sphingobacteriaceae bacterium]|nr:TPM domain-containing protein [Sphingobacteriaceae bacterium]
MGLFTEQQQEQISNAIAAAEKNTSGEIRIAVEKKCQGDAFDMATQKFFALGMDKTALRNGVLIYLAYEDKKFAIIGDSGINKVVPPDFWEMAKVAMKAHFSNANFVEGLVAGVALAGEQLAAFFPYESGDVNEIPNEIVFLDKHND